MANVYEIQQSLNILAGTPVSGAGTLEAQKAANVYAGTTNLEILAALNCKYYGVTTWPMTGFNLTPPTHPVLDFDAVCNKLNGTPASGAGSLPGQAALSQLAGGAV